MTKRSIDSNWKKLLKTGEVTHKKKKKPKADYIKKTKDGKKTIWFDVDQVKLDGWRIFLNSKFFSRCLILQKLKM